MWFISNLVIILFALGVIVYFQFFAQAEKPKPKVKPRILRSIKDEVIEEVAMDVPMKGEFFDADDIVIMRNDLSMYFRVPKPFVFIPSYPHEHMQFLGRDLSWMEIWEKIAEHTIWRTRKEGKVFAIL